MTVWDKRHTSERQLRIEKRTGFWAKRTGPREKENEWLDLAARHPRDLAAIWQEQKRRGLWEEGGQRVPRQARGWPAPPGLGGGELLESLSRGRGRLRL